MSKRYTLGVSHNPVFTGATLFELLDGGKWCGAYAVVGAVDNISDSCEITGGEFYGGFFLSGNITGGQFHRGIFHSGVINGGVFHGGVFDGAVLNGGTFNGGTFNGGVFNAGVFASGIFHTGIYNGGEYNASADFIYYTPIFDYMNARIPNAMCYDAVIELTEVYPI